MKKQVLALSAIIALGMTACNNNQTTGYTDAQVDSMVAERVEAMRLELTTSNDSLIEARAYEIADSIIAASKSTSTGKTTTVAKKPATTAPSKPTTTNTVGNGKPSMKNNDGTVGSGKPSMKSEDGTVGNGKPSMK